MYDQKSKLNKVQNLQERKEEAAKKAKMDITKKPIQDIMDMKNEDVNRLIFYYLSYFQHNNRFDLLMSDQQLFWNIQKILKDPIEDGLTKEQIVEEIDTRAALSKRGHEIQARIDYLYSEIYGGDMEEIAQMEVRKMLTPEIRLKQLA